MLFQINVNLKHVYDIRMNIWYRYEFKGQSGRKIFLVQFISFKSIKNLTKVSLFGNSLLKKVSYGWNTMSFILTLHCLKIQIFCCIWFEQNLICSSMFIHINIRLLIYAYMAYAKCTFLQQLSISFTLNYVENICSSFLLKLLVINAIIIIQWYHILGQMSNYLIHQIVHW